MFAGCQKRLDVPVPSLYRFGINKVAPRYVRDWGGLVYANAQNLDDITGSYILAPPHRSWLDIAAVAVPTYTHDKTQVHFLAKDEFWQSKIKGAVLDATGAFKVDREQKKLSDEIVHQVGKLAAGNAAMCIFFEAGIKEGPLKLSDFRRMMGMLAIMQGIPVVPMGLVGVDEEHKDGWPMAVSYGKPIHVEKAEFNPLRPPKDVRARLTELRADMFNGIVEQQAAAYELQQQAQRSVFFGLGDIVSQDNL